MAIDAIARIERRGVDDEEGIGTHLQRTLRRLRIPDVLADQRRETHAVQFDGGRLVARGEVALLVEDRVVRQRLLAIPHQHVAVADPAQRVVATLAFLHRMADDQVDAAHALGDLREVFVAGPDEARTQDQVFGEVTGEREFRENDQACTEYVTRAFCQRDDAVRILGDGRDREIELRERDADGRHDISDANVGAASGRDLWTKRSRPEAAPTRTRLTCAPSAPLRWCGRDPPATSPWSRPPSPAPRTWPPPCPCRPR